ncbi:MAG: hypothetical protein WCG94_07900 [Methanothrix sp.]
MQASMTQEGIRYGKGEDFCMFYRKSQMGYITSASGWCKSRWSLLPSTY